MQNMYCIEAKSSEHFGLGSVIQMRWISLSVDIRRDCSVNQESSMDFLCIRHAKDCMYFSVAECIEINVSLL